MPSEQFRMETVEALRNTRKGRLRYCRDWSPLEEGILEEDNSPPVLSPYTGWVLEKIISRSPKSDPRLLAKSTPEGVSLFHGLSLKTDASPSNQHSPLPLSTEAPAEAQKWNTTGSNQEPVLLSTPSKSTGVEGLIHLHKEIQKLKGKEQLKQRLEQQEQAVKAASEAASESLKRFDELKEVKQHQDYQHLQQEIENSSKEAQGQQEKLKEEHRRRAKQAFPTEADVVSADLVLLKMHQLLSDMQREIALALEEKKKQEEKLALAAAAAAEAQKNEELQKQELAKSQVSDPGKLAGGKSATCSQFLFFSGIFQLCGITAPIILCTVVVFLRAAPVLSCDPRDPVDLPVGRAGKHLHVFFRILGYQVKDGKVEPQDNFLKRMSGMIRLYAAILQLQWPYRDKQGTHPHGLNHAWRWVAQILNMEPLADVTATILFDFLEVCGNALMKQYQGQFWKMLLLIQEEYFPRIESITSPGEMGSLIRFKQFLKECLQRKNIPLPKGYLPPSFWKS
ncbi:mRNA export factor GLE1 [Ahaetulla prasina]|uniref:mRNA export factor GLE1 n=1 Tax=Ahaetulla prasina TaxID=499056 RepID=UPI0026490F0D|nr:mRNA export factor GLE1 [Ahaetulla prasina]